MKTDLQMHSNCSDGVLSPKELIRACKKVGLDVVSLTDHDTVAGLRTAQAEAQNLGIKFIPGVEISAEREGESIHILGYEIDSENPELVKKLAYYRQQRKLRAVRIIQKLESLGFEVDTKILERKEESVGRPHIAQAVRNRDISVSEFMQKWLLPGRPAYVAREKLSVENAIELIHKAGGKAVWAHPTYTFDDLAKIEKLAKEFKSYGLDGIEVKYFTYTQAQREFLDKLADKLDLEKTAGSDFHGGDHPAKLGEF